MQSHRSAALAHLPHAQAHQGLRGVVSAFTISFKGAIGVCKVRGDERYILSEPRVTQPLKQIIDSCSALYAPY